MDNGFDKREDREEQLDTNLEEVRDDQFHAEQEEVIEVEEQGVILDENSDLDQDVKQNTQEAFDMNYEHTNYENRNQQSYDAQGYGTPHYKAPDYSNPNYSDSNYSDSNYSDSNYSDPNYSNSNYSNPNYGTPGYGAPNYGDFNQQPPKRRKPKKQKKGAGKWVACVAMALVFGVVASATFQASNIAFQRFTGNKFVGTNGNKVTTTEVTTNKGNQAESDIADVVDAVMPSVVSITNLSVQQVQDFFGGVRQYESQSSGSGIIIAQNDKELLLVTNNHVVEGCTNLTVTFVDGESVEAKVKGTDADIDLAIIAVQLDQIKDDTLGKIKTATLGDSDEIRVGETAIAIGNALGYGQSVTNGIISAKNRELEGFSAPLIQTNAAINPGNSGGALLNGKGEVIGINTVKVNANAVEGMGYAIPISDVTEIINQLMNRVTREKVDVEQRGMLGIKGTDVDEKSSQIYSMPEGVFISEVIKGGSAEKAGLTKGNIITKFDGIRVDSMATLKHQLEYYKAGETVKVTVQIPEKNGEYKEETVELTLQKQS